MSGSHGEFLDCEPMPGVLGDVEDRLAGHVSVVERPDSVEGESFTQTHKNKGDQTSLSKIRLRSISREEFQSQRLLLDVQAFF